MTREAAILQGLLAQVRWRLGLGAALRGIARATTVVALVILGWALATMVVPLPFPLRAAVGVAAGGLALSLPLLAWVMRPRSLVAARLIDRRLGLADRLSTAAELLAKSPAVSVLPHAGPAGLPHAGPPGLARLQIADAVEVARGVVPRAAAPVACPREIGVAAACAAALVLWVQFLQGWTIPGLPAARNAAVIHREGRALTTIARQLEARARTGGLPEARRAAPQLQELGRRLAGPRVSREDALDLLQETSRQLQTAQNRVERRLAGAGLRGTYGARDAHITPTTPADPDRLQQAIRELEALTGHLRSETSPGAREDLSRRLRALSESLDEMNAPASSRRSVEAARREVERDRLSGATSALGDALQDLQGIERMLGDEQALGEARRQIQTSAERIARGGPLGSSAEMTGDSPAESAPPPTAPGPNPVTSSSEAASPPPRGPNQGSLPGQGRGPALGAPTQRLGGTRIEEHLTGRQGEGAAMTRDLLAPGRAGPPRLPVAPVPADVAHENDRALAHDPVPPAYLTVIRRYFEALGSPR